MYVCMHACTYVCIQVLPESCIVDTLRCSIIFSDISGMVHALNFLAGLEGHPIDIKLSDGLMATCQMWPLRLKNKFNPSDIDPAHFRNLLLNMKFQVDDKWGFVEVQVHHKEILHYNVRVCMCIHVCEYACMPVYQKEILHYNVRVCVYMYVCMHACTRRRSSITTCVYFGSMHPTLLTARSHAAERAAPCVGCLQETSDAHTAYEFFRSALCVHRSLSQLIYASKYARPMPNATQADNDPPAPPSAPRAHQR